MSRKAICPGVWPGVLIVSSGPIRSPSFKNCVGFDRIAGKPLNFFPFSPGSSEKSPANSRPSLFPINNAIPGSAAIISSTDPVWSKCACVRMILRTGAPISLAAARIALALPFRFASIKIKPSSSRTRKQFTMPSRVSRYRFSVSLTIFISSFYFAVPDCGTASGAAFSTSTIFSRCPTFSPTTRSAEILSPGFSPSICFSSATR